MAFLDYSELKRVGVHCVPGCKPLPDLMKALVWTITPGVHLLYVGILIW